MFKDKTEEQLRKQLRALRFETRLAKAEDAFDYLSGCGELTLGKMMHAASLSSDGCSRHEVDMVWLNTERTRAQLERFRAQWLAKLGKAIREMSGQRP